MNSVSLPASLTDWYYKQWISWLTYWLVFPLAVWKFNATRKQFLVYDRDHKRKRVKQLVTRSPHLPTVVGLLKFLVRTFAYIHMPPERKKNCATIKSNTYRAHWALLPQLGFQRYDCCLAAYSHWRMSLILPNTDAIMPSSPLLFLRADFSSIPSLALYSKKKLFCSFHYSFVRKECLLFLSIHESEWASPVYWISVLCIHAFVATTAAEAAASAIVMMAALVFVVVFFFFFFVFDFATNDFLSLSTASTHA